MYRTYLHAAERLGLSERASGYWALHIKEDERHGRWMLDDVALPLVDRCAAVRAAGRADGRARPAQSQLKAPELTPRWDRPGRRYPLHAWELLLGYDQERFMAQRASAAVLNRIRYAVSP